MPTETPSNDQRTAGSLQRGVMPLRVANPQHVPSNIAVCPECGGWLWWQVTTTDGLNDLDVDCENDVLDDDETEHRHWQGEWQPVIERVKAWILKRHNDKLCLEAGQKRNE